MQDLSAYLEGVVESIVESLSLKPDETAKEVQYNILTDPQDVLSNYFNYLHINKQTIQLKNGLTAFYMVLDFGTAKYRGFLAYRTFFELDLGDEFLVFMKGYLRVGVPTAVTININESNGAVTAKYSFTNFCTTTNASGTLYFIESPGDFYGIFPMKEIIMRIENYRDIWLTYGSIGLLIIPIKKISDVSWTAI